MDLDRAIWTLNIAASAGLMARMLYSKLAGTYRFLFVFVLFDVIQSLVLREIPAQTKTYALGYMIESTIELLLVVAVVMELYAVALAQHPALARFGSRTVGYVLIAAGAVAASALRIDDAVPAGQWIVLHRFFRVERTVDFGVVVFLAAISVFLVWFPVRVSRNVAFYVCGFAAFYASRSAGLLLVNVLPKSWQTPVDETMLAVSFACLLFLAVCLRRETGSTILVRTRSSPAAVAHVAGQLDSINAVLSRAAKR